MSTELKESLIKEVKKDMMIMLCHIENINKKIEILEKNSMKVLELNVE